MWKIGREVSGVWRSLRYDLSRRPSRPVDDAPTDLIPLYEPAHRPRRRVLVATTFGVLTLAGAAGTYFVVVGGLSALASDEAAPPNQPPAMATPSSPTPTARGVTPVPTRTVVAPVVRTSPSARGPTVPRPASPSPTCPCVTPPVPARTSPPPAAETPDPPMSSSPPAPTASASPPPTPEPSDPPPTGG